MADQAPQFLDAHGEPIAAPLHLDSNGDPIGGVTAPTAADMLSHRSVSSDAPESPSWLQRTVEGMNHPTPGTQLGMDVMPFAVGAIGSGIARLRGAPPMPVERPPTPLRDFLRTSGAAMEQAPKVGLTGRILGRLLQKTPTPQTFQDLPLAQQMEQLPLTPAPVTGRSAGPPVSTVRFNDLPLASQMPSLPSTGGVSSLRAGGPPMQPQTPFHELPLASQMDRLPDSGGMPTGRVPSPPAQTSTPFHQLPVYQQMEQLPTTGPVPSSGRTGMPPFQPGSMQGTLQMLSPVDQARVAAFVEQGVSADQAIKLVNVMRARGAAISHVTAPQPPTSPVATIAPMPSHVPTQGALPDAFKGLPNDEEMMRIIQERNRTGKWPER